MINNQATPSSEQQINFDMLQINTENFATAAKLLKYLDMTEDFALILPFDNPPSPISCLL